MDSFGDILYVLIIIAWFLYSIFGRKKKKDAGKTAPDSKEKGKDFSTVLGDLIRGEKESTLEKEESRRRTQQSEEKRFNRPQSVAERKPAYESYDNEEDYEFGNYESLEDEGSLEKIVDEEATYKREKEKIKKEDHRAYVKKAKAFRAEVEEEKEVDDFEFDLEKAVIYSEILKRPKF